MQKKNKFPEQESEDRIKPACNCCWRVQVKNLYWGYFDHLIYDFIGIKCDINQPVLFDIWTNPSVKTFRMYQNIGTFGVSLTFWPKIIF